MEFIPLPVAGSYLIKSEPVLDFRGSFTRLLCTDELAKVGLNFTVRQVNSSFNQEKQTLRGCHFQVGQYAETKIIGVLSGRIFDVCVDLREESSTYGAWTGVYLDALCHSMLCVPKGCAHGYLTLEPHSEVLYFSDQAYNPAAERGLCWNDPSINIDWPESPTYISEKDANWDWR